jgi:Ca2+-binding RTX toxin-like protein
MPRRRWVPPALVLLCAAPLTLVVLPLGSAAAPPRCDGVTATVVGTGGPDTLTGTPQRDVVVGLGGDDVIEGLGGNDLLCGGAGADRLVGGPGRDVLLGGADARRDGAGGTFLVGDTLAGGPGDDRMTGGGDTRRASVRRRPDTYSFADAASGVTVDLSGTLGRATGEGADTIKVGPASGITGSAYADDLTGSDGPDTVDAGPGPDAVATRGGRDTVFPDGLLGADGRDVVSTGSGPDLVSSLTGRDEISTGDGHDFVEAFSPDPSVVDTGTGDDYLGVHVAPGNGAAVRGGSGDDVVTFYGGRLAGQSPPARFTVDRRSGTTSASGDVAATGTIEGIEGHRFAGPLRWRFLGAAAPERVWAMEGGPLRAVTGRGDDQVTGSPRDDYVDGGSGTDAAYRGGGSDTCVRVERGDC